MAKKPTERTMPGLDMLRSPLNVGKIPGDVTPDYNVPPSMTPRDPLGNLPKENNFSGGKKGKGR